MIERKYGRVSARDIVLSRENHVLSSFKQLFCVYSNKHLGIAMYRRGRGWATDFYRIPILQESIKVY